MSTGSEMSEGRRLRLSRRRRLTDKVMTGVFVLSVLVVIVPLASIISYLLIKGIGALSVDFLTKLPAPVGEPGGGMANAIVGSGIVVGLASLMGIPIGVLAGIYTAEFGRNTRLGFLVRFFSEVLQGVPSIVIGIVAYSVVVRPMGRFSAIAGGVALAMMMIPFLVRTTEEAILTVPNDVREAGLALGQPKWRVILGIVLRTAQGPIMTGIMLAVARIAGETAPLLFTALNNRFWHQGLTSPIATLTVQIYTYAIAPFSDWNQQAWAGAIVLIALVLLLNILSRMFARSKYVERS